MPCWRSWCDSHSGHPGQVPTKTVLSRSPVTLPASGRRCQIAGGLQPGRAPPPYRLLRVPRLFPQGGVPFPHAAPRCAWRSPSNTSAVESTCPSLRSHHTGDRQREFRVLPGFNGQLFAAGRGDLVDPRPPIVRRHAPDTVDPAVELETLESGIERALLDEELVVGGLLDELDDAVAVEVAPRQGPQNQHVQRTGQRIVLLRLASHTKNS